MNKLQSNSGMILIAALGLFVALGLAMTVEAYWQQNDRLFSLVQNVAIGFQGSLFTLLQIERKSKAPPQDDEEKK